MVVSASIYKIILCLHSAILCPFLPRVVRMQRLIKSFAISIFCLQWPVLALATDASCQISKQANPLIRNTILATELNAEGSFFSPTCSCGSSNQTLINNPNSIVKFSIIQSKTYNGSPEIMPPLDLSYSILTNPQTYPYSVKVATTNPQLLQSASDYFVTVQFEILNPPQCEGGGNGEEL